MAVKIFAKQMRIVSQKIKDFIQFQKTKAVESLITTCLGNSLVF